MVDQALAPTNSVSKTINVAELKHIDPLELQINGAEKLSNFFEELKLGLKQGRTTIYLNIPFILGENPDKNEYELELNPITPESEVGRRIITLSHIVNLIDEIVYWSLKSGFPNNEFVKANLNTTLFHPSILELPTENLTEEWLHEKDQFDLFKQQVSASLRVFQQLVFDGEKTANTESNEEPGGANRSGETNFLGDFSIKPGVASDGIDTKTDDTPTPTTTLSPNSPLYEKNTYRYESISIHAGFLYNHITSNIFGLYPNFPLELRQLPPLAEYQLRQEILQYLYQLSPTELDQLNKFGRLALGEDLFRRLILRNPRLFVEIEHHIQTEAQTRQIEFSTPDPLHLEDRTVGFQHEAYIRDLPQTTEQLTSSEVEASAANLFKATTPDVYNLSLAQSDEGFKAGLHTLGIEVNQVITIRNLILSYIQTTGLDPMYVVAHRNSTELQFLFGGLSLRPDQTDQFIALVSSYWQYQLQKLQSITKRRVVPDLALAEKSAKGELTSIDVQQLAQDNWETAKASAAEKADTRLTILASLTSSADLEQNSTQRRVLVAALNDLYDGDQVLIDQAIQQIIAIQRAERAALAQEAAAAFNHRQFLAFQARTKTANSDDARTPAVPTGLAAFNALSLAEKQQLMGGLFAGLDPNEDAPQSLYSDLLNLDSPDFETGVNLSGQPTSVLGQARSWLGTANGVRKNINRLRTIGSAPSQLAAAASNPAGFLASKTIGAGARAIFGDRVGNIVEKGAMLVGSIGGLLSTIGSLITTGLTLAASGIGLIAGAIFAGGPLLIAGAIGGVIAGGAYIYQNVIRPIFTGGSTPPPINPSAGLGASSANSPITPATTATVATPASPIAIGTAATSIGLGGIAVTSAVMVMSTHGAFLSALPTLGVEDISPYVVIEKVATPSRKFDAPNDITYTIRIRAKEGFQLQLTEAPTDQFTITFGKREGETTARETTSTIPASTEYDAFLAKLATFHTDNPIIGTEPITIGSYTIPFGSNPGTIDYNDANVRNVFSIKFNVLDVNGQPIPEVTGATIASTGEVICFGNCPQSQGGCWPVSGVVGQIPYGHSSHAVSNLNSDAYDIGAPPGTPVYAPFAGEACVGTIDTRYGNHVVMKVDEQVAYEGDVGVLHLIFAHLSSIESSIENSCQSVAPGDKVGEVGSTGNSTGPHLHYEARWNGFGTGSKKNPSLLVLQVPEVVKLRDPIRSCYDQ